MQSLIKFALKIIIVLIYQHQQYEADYYLICCQSRKR